MKVLFVLPEFGPQAPGGIARFYSHAIPPLVQAGCEVSVCLTQAGTAETVIDGVRLFGPSDTSILAHFERLTHFAVVPGLRYQLALACAAFEACGEGSGFDVVETTDWGMLYAPWLTREPRQAPVVVQLHGSPGQIGFRDPIAGMELSDMLTRMLETAMLPRADKVQTPGPRVAAEWRVLLEREVEVLPPAWHPSPQPVRGDVGDFGLVASRLQDWKGPEVLCQALALLGADAPQVHWAGGDHPFGTFGRSMSSHLAETYPSVWGRKFIYLGSKRPDEVRQLQWAAKFVVHPSRWDCFPLAAVEAMDLAKPLVCSDGAGVSSLIETGVNGFTFASEAPDRLAEAVSRASDLDDLSRRRMGNLARATIENALDPVAITRRRLAGFRAISPQKREAHPWLESLFGPQRTGSSLDFLDALPLRALARYGLRRLATRQRDQWLRRRN